jgi:hypothetical protein
MKYAVATLEDINPRLISRPNEPDFSDLFILSEAEYQQLLASWAVENTFHKSEHFNHTNDLNDVNNISSVNDINYISSATDFNDSSSPIIRGPYGPPWPFVTHPIEFEIGSATVRIEIEDENAKYPLGWALLGDKEVQREAQAGFETFCEWMRIENEQIDSLKRQLKDISKIRPFKLEFKPIEKVERRKVATRTITSRGESRKISRYRPKRITIPVSKQVTQQATSFTKLFHSSLIDTEVLGRPTIVSESRKESALKYMGMWASRKVNINTAPRHVLEAAFTFGGDANKIADEIIRRRCIQPFKDIEDLRKSLLRYSDSIKKCENYITTTSNFFTIRVTAVSGVAEASAVIAVTKDGEKTERIAAISG